MYNTLNELKNSLSKEEYDEILILHKSILNSIGNLIVKNIKTCKFLSQSMAFNTAEHALRNSQENLLVSMFKRTNLDPKEIEKLLTEMNSDTKKRVINRLYEKKESNKKNST